MTTYEVSKKRLEGHYFLTYFVSGIIAETMACLYFLPIDVIKERMQV